MWRSQPERQMPGPYPQSMIGIDELNDPVSFRYEVRTPFGLVAQVLSDDIKIHLDDAAYYNAVGESLWSSAIATAISRSCTLELMWCVKWKVAPLALPHVPLLTRRGQQSGTPAGRNRTVQIMLHTGHGDSKGPQLLQLPSTPIAWQTDTMLNDRGWDSLMTWAHGVKMGLAGDEIGGDLQQLIMYPAAVDPTIENLSGTLFRRVTHIKVLQYTDRCPDFDGGIWP